MPPSTSFNPDDQDQLLAAYLSGKKPLSTNLAGIQRDGASTLPDAAFQPGDPDNGPSINRMAFSPSSSQPNPGLQPSAAAGKVLMGNGPAKIPPPDWTPPPPPPQQMPPPPSLGEVADNGGQAGQMLADNLDKPADLPIQNDGIRIPDTTVKAQTPDAIGKMQGLMAQRSALTVPQMVGSRPQDIDPVTGKEKLAPRLASWGQRLGLALLAATKLAPYAQEIVHPDYMQQMAQYTGAQKGLDDQITNEGKIQTATKDAALEGATQDLRQEQAALNAAKADPHYGQKMVNATYAKENMPWLKPEVGADGQPQYWVDKNVENTLTKPTPAVKSIVVPEGASVWDPEQGKMVATGTPKTEKIPEGEMPLTNTDNLNKALEARWQVLNPNATLPPYFTLSGDARQKDYDRIDKSMNGLEGAVATKAQRDILNEARRQTAVLAAQNHTDKADHETKTAGFKAFSPALDSAERFNVMSQNYADAVNNHDQQAMLSLLANHIGMTMGLQKGARINQHMYAEAQNSLPWLQGIGAKFDGDGYLSGVTLSPPQMHQMLSLGRERFSQDIQKARNEATYQGVADDGPHRTPSKATMDFYTKESGGNAAQAAQLAAQDGWTVTAPTASGDGHPTLDEINAEVARRRAAAGKK